jgi:NitT/TauT family transport system substrate-binding protein
MTRVRLAPLTLGTVLAALLTVLPAAAADKVNFRLDWTFYGTHAPFYLGVDRGWYQAEGIELTIAEGNG